MLAQTYKVLMILIVISIPILILRHWTAQPSMTQVSFTPTPTFSENILTGKVNTWRKQFSLPPLTEEDSLCNYAKIRSEQIKKDWNHDKFMTDRCLLTNYITCGENLSKNYSSEEETLNAWIDSSTHRDNLQGDWTNMCIRCSEGYCAQEFGR